MRIRSEKEYSKLFENASIIKGYGIHKVVPKENFSRLRKLELFAFFKQEALETIIKKANLLEEDTSKLAPNLKNLKPEYELLFMKAVKWNKTTIVIKVYRHPKDPSEAFKIELIRQVQGKAGRKYIPVFSGMSSMVSLLEQITQGHSPVQHTHFPFLTLNEFLEMAEEHLKEENNQSKLKEFYSQRESYSKKKNLCLEDLNKYLLSISQKAE